MTVKSTFLSVVAGTALIAGAQTASAADGELNVAYFLEWPMPFQAAKVSGEYDDCLLYTSPSPRDATLSRMPSSA